MAMRQSNCAWAASPGSSPRSSDAGIIAHTHRIIASYAWTNLPPMQEVQRPLHSVLASAGKVLSQILGHDGARMCSQ